LRVIDENRWKNLMADLRGRFADELKEELREVEEAASTAGGSGATLTEEQFRAIKEKNGLIAFLAPRGIGLTAWNPDARKQAQIRRRFMLLGQTLDGMRVWDIRRACQALREVPRARQAGLTLEAEGRWLSMSFTRRCSRPASKARARRAPPRTRMNPGRIT
jgi:hypothetical protein